MVNNKGKGGWADPNVKPKDEDAPRRLKDRVYDLSTIQQELRNGAKLVPATRDCRRDGKKFGWDVAKWREFLLGLRETDYYKSEWCMTSSQMWIKADAYRFNLLCRNEYTGWEDNIRHYYKFGKGKKDSVILLISCHPDEEKL